MMMYGFCLSSTYYSISILIYAQQLYRLQVSEVLPHCVSVHHSKSDFTLTDTRRGEIGKFFSSQTLPSACTTHTATHAQTHAHRI